MISYLGNSEKGYHIMAHNVLHKYDDVTAIIQNLDQNTPQSKILGKYPTSRFLHCNLLEVSFINDFPYLLHIF